MIGPEKTPDLVDDLFSFEGSFDINAAFQDAMSNVVNNESMALEEKVRRMEVIVLEGTTEVYQNFVDFRSLAEQMEMACAHDHNLHQAADTSEALNSFLESFTQMHDAKDKDDRKKAKCKKKRGWLYILLDY